MTLEQAQAGLARWLALDEKIAQGQQAVALENGRQVTYVDAEQVSEKIRFYESAIRNIQRSKRGRRFGRAARLAR